MTYIVSFDLELDMMVPENVDWFAETSPRITCASVFSEVEGTRFFFSELGSDFAPYLNAADTARLHDEIWRHVQLGAIVVTWGGCAVDFKALYSALKNDPLRQDQCKQIVRSHVDMTIASVTDMGMMMGLDAAARGMGQGQKCNSTSKDSPRLWAASKNFQVLEHVRNDAVLTYKVYLAVVNVPTPSLTWMTKRGKPRTWYLSSKNISVEECMKRSCFRVPFFVPNGMNRDIAASWAFE